MPRGQLVLLMALVFFQTLEMNFAIFPTLGKVLDHFFHALENGAAHYVPRCCCHGKTVYKARGSSYVASRPAGGLPGG